MTHKILDEIALSRISINLNELKKLISGSIKDLPKIKTFCENIESTIEMARDLHEEQCDKIWEAIDEKMDDILLESEEIREYKDIKATFEALR